MSKSSDAKSNIASLVEGGAVENPAPFNEQMIEVRQKDLLSMVVIIDSCSKRGAFEGSELEFIGQLRSGLVKTLSPPTAETGQSELLTE